MDLKDVLTGIYGWTITIKPGPPITVELRRKFSQGDLFLIVATQGYNYKHYRVDAPFRSTKDLNIHMSSNGPVQMTFLEMSELQELIAAARAYLESLPG